MNLLIQYIVALSNLYGIVPLKKIVEIYNSQNEDHISLEDVEAYYKNPPKELEKSFVYPYRGCFVNQSVIEFDDFDRLMAQKSNKPYYVPGKDELLKYTDNCYTEETREYRALRDYLRDHFFNGDEKRADNLADDIQGLFQFAEDFSIQMVFDRLNRMGVSFEDLDQVNEVVHLITNMSNNTRIWENNGHTPHEIMTKYEKPHLRPLPAEPFAPAGSGKRNDWPKQYIGRNAPCPCGSGKKYKNCCMNKDQKQPPKS